MWVDKSTKPNKRFTYLLLEDGDYYIQDWIATCRPSLFGGSQRLRLQPSQHRRLKGCLRLCARSIFFEPDYMKAPILMFPLNKVTQVGPLAEPPVSSISSSQKVKSKLEGFFVETSLVVKMKEDGADAPYTFNKNKSNWWFSLEYAPAHQLLQQLQSLLSINLLPHLERDMILQNTAARREAQTQFDITRLVDLSEHVLLNCPAAQITPLIREPGRLVLTQARLYFQPLHNLNDDSPVRSQPLTAIIAVARRRHALRHTGIEIFFREEGAQKRSTNTGLADGSSAFFNFRSVKERDSVVASLLGQLGGRNGAAAAAGSLLEADSSWLHHVTAAWQARLVSNYDYLVYLNLAAGRSFCDLTQWPVMPWVLCDYHSSTLDLSDPKVFRDLSKPIGALNPTRLAVFKERYWQMPHGDEANPPFLYGTHYSTPGYVLYWLVRAAPAHMLRLQNGRFDAPDRLFVSISESWDSVLANPADLKELIPEFFALPSDFLIMREGLNLGVRQNGMPVGDVALPSWASDPNDFILKHREALECDHVSNHLHKWIDLIFGYKQRGEAALSADNLFHYLTYEGAVDLEQIDDPTQRPGLEAQINEFGQAPRQLFTSPHPAKLPADAGGSEAGIPSRYSKSEKGFTGHSAEFLARIMTVVSSLERSKEVLKEAEGAPDSQLALEKDLGKLYRRLSLAAHYDGQVPGVDERSSCRTEQAHLQGDTGSQGLSGEAVLEDTRKTHCPAKPQEGIEVLMESEHAADAMSECFSERQVSEDLSPTAPQSEEAIIKKEHSWHWMLRQRLSEPQALKIHRGPVNALLLSDDNASESLTMYSVGKDGFIKVYSISEGFQVRATKLGNLPLSSLALAQSNDAYPTMLAGSYDDCVYAYSVDYGRALGKIRVHDDTVSCVRLRRHNQRMITSSWDATVKVWSIEEGRGGWASSFTTNASISNADRAPESEFMDHEAAVWSLDIQQDGNLGVSGGEDGVVLAWDMRHPTSSVWQASCFKGPATAVRFVHGTDQVVVASGDGCLHLLEGRKGGTEIATKNCEAYLRCCEIAGSTVIAGSDDGALHFWAFAEAEGSTLFLDNSPIHDHCDAINSISIAEHPAGQSASLATGGEDCTIQVYNIARRNPL